VAEHQPVALFIHLKKFQGQVFADQIFLRLTGTDVGAGNKPAQPLNAD
jgi:hypothetical protein